MESQLAKYNLNEKCQGPQSMEFMSFAGFFRQYYCFSVKCFCRIGYSKTLHKYEGMTISSFYTQGGGI